MRDNDLIKSQIINMQEEINNLIEEKGLAQDRELYFLSVKLDRIINVWLENRKKHTTMK